MRKIDSNPNSTTRLSLDRSEICFFFSFFSHTFLSFCFSPFFSDFFLTFFLFFSFLFSLFFSLYSFSPSFQDKLDKMQIGSGEDVNDLNYDYDNERVAHGGNLWMG